MHGTSSKVEGFGDKVAQTLIQQNFFSFGKTTDKRGGALLRVTSGRFRPEIDGLRFFAIIPVMFGHLFEWVFRRQNQLGFLGDLKSSDYRYFVNHLPGVLLFFAISGYILTYQISNASKGGYNWSKYKKYIVRRFKRIAPPYYILLIATFIVVAIIGFRPSSAHQFDASHVPVLTSLIVSFFYSHWLIFGQWPRLFAAGWTLEVETQYYIIAPVLTLIYLNIKNKKVKVAAGISVIFLSSVLASQFEVGNYWAGTIMKFFQYFFTGMLALELQDDLRNVVKIAPRWALNFLTVIAVVFFISIQAPESGAGIRMFEYYAINILCILAMFVAVSIEGNVLRRICVNRYVVIIGGACYSIYLTHGQVIFLLQDFIYKHRLVFQETYLAMLFNVILEIPIALLVGLTFYLVIEKPFMMWGRSAVRQPNSPRAETRPI